MAYALQGGSSMQTGARVNPKQMTDILFALPRYKSYRKQEVALDLEEFYRLTLCTMLQDCAQRLVDYSESPIHSLGNDQLLVLEKNIDSMHTVYDRLFRQGEIKIETPAVIVHLNKLDADIIMTLEFVWNSVSEMLEIIEDKKQFRSMSQLINKTLYNLTETAEKRNSLMGLGWESEIGLKSEGANSADA